MIITLLPFHFIPLLLRHPCFKHVTVLVNALMGCSASYVQSSTSCYGVTAMTGNGYCEIATRTWKLQSVFFDLIDCHFQIQAAALQLMLLIIGDIPITRCTGLCRSV